MIQYDGKHRRPKAPAPRSTGETSMDVKSALGHLAQRLRNGGISRRDFIGAAGALGVSGAFVEKALAQTPKRGGQLILGINHASSTHTLDPALASSSYVKCAITQ